MSFWNINIDDWIKGRLHLDENISACFTLGMVVYKNPAHKR